MQPAVLEQLKVSAGETFRITDHDPRWLPPHLRDLPREEVKAGAADLLAESKAALAEAQELLYADDRYSLLLVFQAMDAAGKDGTIKHVMSGVNPQGVQVSSFKVPSALELDHNFLWRYTVALPERGRIGIFNRSYYEEVLVVKVHPNILASQKLPPGARGRQFWNDRYQDINAFERHLARNGTVILKFFLNVSQEEQRDRFLERLDNPDKHWKFSPNDLAERAYWDDYQAAFEEAINATSTRWAPWYVIPADRKWAMRAAVADIVSTTITGMDLRYPEVPAEVEARFGEIKAQLEAEKGEDAGPSKDTPKKSGKKNKRKSKG
ncbi:MAG: polyphosphate kinase 2 family protein [Candidatus Nanopelagicales bacterium]|uniref:polyphosphate kinase 2 family protein n=1 Tax=Gordonia sp. (in: high G+C Gram-positive bacteria) TaxID=84139 RepID=UPI0035272864